MQPAAQATQMDIILEMISFYLCVTFVPLWQKTESWPATHSGASLEHCTDSEYVYMHTNILLLIILSRIWWLYGTWLFISLHMILTPSMFLILHVDAASSSTPPHPSNFCNICTDSAAWSSITEDKSSNQTHSLHHQCWTFTLACWHHHYIVNINILLLFYWLHNLSLEYR